MSLAVAEQVVEVIQLVAMAPKLVVVAARVAVVVEVV
jgi:hypothetical protein